MEDIINYHSMIYCKYENIIEMANIQKYKTTWISTTRESGHQSNKYSIITKHSNTIIENLEDDL